MSNIDMKEVLKEAFKTHMFMQNRDYHTVNELLYVLRHDEKLRGLNGVNISIRKADNRWTCIPCLDAFVDIKTLSVWFDDDAVEFDVDEFEFEGNSMKYDNITVYEREVV